MAVYKGLWQQFTGDGFGQPFGQPFGRNRLKNAQIAVF